MPSRKFLATTAAACLSPLHEASAIYARAVRRVTLLHKADTHAQSESHPDYVPGEQPEIQQMGGFSCLETAIDRERARTPLSLERPTPSRVRRAKADPRDRPPHRLHMSTQPIANCGDHRPWLTRLVTALDWHRHYERKPLPGAALVGERAA